MISRGFKISDKRDLLGICFKPCTPTVDAFVTTHTRKLLPLDRTKTYLGYEFLQRFNLNNLLLPYPIKNRIEHIHYCPL